MRDIVIGFIVTVVAVIVAVYVAKQLKVI